MAIDNTDTILQAVQDIIEYRFRERLILLKAMQVARSSACSAGDRESADGSKRLAVIGDTALVKWYNVGTVRGYLDGERTPTGLHRFVNNNPSQRHVVSPIAIAATMEASLGAAFLDSSLEIFGELMQTLGLLPIAPQDAGENH